MKYCKNQYGIPIKKWCVTCQFYDSCKQKANNMSLKDNCWVMKDAYQKAGKGDGRLRKLVIEDTLAGKTFKLSD